MKIKLREEQSPEDFDSVWPKYGLKESPYSTSPMRLVGILPLETVFCGRDKEVNKLKKVITSSNSSRVMITGDFGVGKTTFANYVRWLLCVKKGSKAKYLTTNLEIKVQSDWDSTKFLASTLSAIYHSSKILDQWKNLNLKSIKSLESYLTTITHIQTGVSIAGVGGKYGENTTHPPVVTPELLENLLLAVCDEVRTKGKQIIIHYNNLENIHNDRLAEIFKSIREYIQIEGLHVLFLGAPAVISALEKYGQVHSVFTRPIILHPLTPTDVLKILHKRCEVLKTERGQYLIPYDRDTVKTLYNQLNQNIRFTFKVLEDTTIMSEKTAPCRVTMNEIKAVQEEEKKEILSTLTDTQIKIISALLERPQLNQKKLATVTGIGITNLTTPVKQLEERGLIVIKKGEKDKRFRYIRISDNSYLKLIFTSESLKKRS